jgi:hypothetical protein
MHAVIGLAALAVASTVLAGCRNASARPCTTGTSDEARRTRILALIDRGLARAEREPAVSRLMAVREKAHRGPICFADFAGLQTDRTLVLDSKSGDAAAAARTAHLMHHLLVASPWTDDSRLPCDVRVARALAVEEQAWSVELALREALAVPTLLYPWENEYRKAPPNDRTRIIRAALERGEPPLGREYAARCSQ